MQLGIKKIAIIGPESTGKSMLSKNLALHYKTLWVKEYARTYLENLNRAYTQQDLNIIAEGQLATEKELLPHANKILFCDTDLYVIKIWSEVKYNNCSLQILNNIVTTPYDFYLLTDIDLPWQADAQREHPSATMRQTLMKMYTDAVVNSGVPFSIISGTNLLRNQNAITAVDLFLQKS